MRLSSTFTGLARPATGRLSCQLACLIALLGVVAVGGCTDKISDSDIRSVGLDETIKLAERDARRDSVLLFIDPRPRRDYEAGHIPGARHIELADLDIRYDADPEITRHDHVLVYGRDPGSAVARAMVKRMIILGYGKKRVRWFEGGYRAWSDAGLPIETVGDGSGDTPE